MPEQTSTAYHYVLTVQLSAGRQSCRSGVLDVPPDTTRQKTLAYLTRTNFPGENNIVVLFFALEPDGL